MICKLVHSQLLMICVAVPMEFLPVISWKILEVLLCLNTLTRGFQRDTTLAYTYIHNVCITYTVTYVHTYSYLQYVYQKESEREKKDD